MTCLSGRYSSPPLASLAIGFATLLWATSIQAQTTISFQEGIGGYAGSLEVFIGPDAADIPGAADGNVIGSTLSKDFLDGKYFDRAGDIQEIQLLMRYDNIFGAGPGQVPLGSKIVNATMTFTTGDGGNAQSNGPYGVAQLLVDFDNTATWNSVTALGGGGGATYPGGHIARPLDNGFRGPMDASTLTTQNTSVADVTRMAQNWSSGQANKGFLVRAGTTDGWEVFTSGVFTNTSYRPKLQITYEPAPTITISTATLQQNLNNYAGTTMSWLQSGLPNAQGEFLGQKTTDAAQVDRGFLDGADLGATSPDDQALIKFGQIFVSQGGSVPDNATILDAQLVVDSTGNDFSANVDTNGNFGARQMLVDWNTTTLYTDFGGNGPDAAQNEAGPVLDATGALIADARTYLDVTNAVKAWQSGAANYGLILEAIDTSDGWSIIFLGSSSPPQLVINYTTDVVVADDADFDADGDVDGDDFLAWQAQYGQTAPATSAVPEPTAFAVGALATLALAGRRQR